MLVWIDAFYKTHKIYNSKLAEEETGQASKKPVKNYLLLQKKEQKTLKYRQLKKQKLLFQYHKK